MAKKRERGQSMLELALVLPFLILLLVATVEAGFALRDYLMLQSANREGARWAVRTPPGADYLDYFHDEAVPEIFDRILAAAEEGGLRTEDIKIIVTHVYVADSGGGDEPTFETFSFPPGFDPGHSRQDVEAIADQNATRTASINATRVNSEFDALSSELVVVEVFYRHETLWGFDVMPYGVGPFGKDWTMYAQSSMRMVGTGRID